MIGGSVGAGYGTNVCAGVVEDAASLPPGRTLVTADSDVAATRRRGRGLPGIGGGGRG